MPERTGAPWFLGLDLGTGSCKAVAVDAAARVLGFAAAAYPAQGADQRWQEQDPDSLLLGLVQAARGAVAQAAPAGPCRGLSIGGALHSLVALDGAGRPLTGVSTWADGRAQGQAAAIAGTSLGRELYQRTGCVPHGMYPLYKLIRLRQERPEMFQRVRRLVSAKEYVLHQLCGQYVVDFSVGSGSGLMNVHELAWDSLALDTAGVQAGQLSELADPRARLGGLAPELARQMGLAPDTPLILGSSDAANSSLGAGCVAPGQLTCMVGTSGALRLISPRPLLDNNARYWCYGLDREHWLVGGAINNGGLALAWFRDLLQQVLGEARPQGRPSFEDLVALAGQAPLGAAGVICLPFLAGERSPHWNLNARAAFCGLRLSHGPEHLARAILEGVAFRLRSVLELLREMGPAVGEVRASGGFTQSPLWLQIVADVLNLELSVPAWGETSCLGAAFWPLLAAGALASLEQAGGAVPTAQVQAPDPQRAQAYEPLYALFTDLYAALSPLFGRWPLPKAP
ncbi:MAG: gluconokinase [Thermodesulfobacteriota bacterium]